MESKAKLLGHPIHQMLIVFPLGLLATAVAFDIVGLATGDAKRSRLERAPRTLGCGMGENVVVVVLFIVSWFLRRPVPENPGGAALGLAFVAVALALVTGWLGGELVDRLGVGVDDEAHLNAPSSLSGRPAREAERSRDMPRAA